MNDMVVDRQALLQILEKVNDPHVPVSLRRMGMLRDVAVEDGNVTISITVPCLACPAADMLRMQTTQAVREVDGVRAVNVLLVWGAGWKREDIDPTAHPLMRQYGLQI